jgi:hypothetical protein
MPGKNSSSILGAHWHVVEASWLYTVHTDQKPVGRSDQIKKYVQGYKPKKGLAMCKHPRPWGHDGIPAATATATTTTTTTTKGWLAGTQSGRKA